MDRWNLAIVVDGNQARFFERRPFNLIEIMENELGRARNQELMDDRPGLSYAGGAGPSSHHGVGADKNPHRLVIDKFAHEVCDEIEKICYSKKPEHLLIVASPRMKGLLLHHLDGHWKKKSSWLDKDLTRAPRKEIRERLINWTP